MISPIISPTSLKKNHEKSIHLKLMLWDYLIYYSVIQDRKNVRATRLTTPIHIGIPVHIMDAQHIKQ